MPSAAANILNAGMSSLLGVSGDAMTFRSTAVTALVDREQVWRRPVPASWIEVLQADVSSIPIPGEQFTDSTNSTQFTVLFVKKINAWYRLECYVLDDVISENITIAGDTYTCHAFSSVDGTDLELGGLSPESVHRVVLERADVSTMFSEGDPVTFRSVATYRVARVQRDQPGAPVILDIRDEASRNT